MMYSSMTSKNVHFIEHQRIDKHIDTAVFGCSFTTEDYKSVFHPELVFDFPKWPNLIAEHFNWNVINCAVSGYSNVDICDKASKFVLANSSIKRIVIALTEWSRIYTIWSNQNVGMYNRIKQSSYYPREEHEEKYLKDIKLIEIAGWDQFREKTNINDQIFSLIVLAKLCKLYDVELSIFQNLPFLPYFGSFNRKNIVLQIGSDNRWEEMKKMYNVKMLGYPMIGEIGGKEAIVDIRNQVSHNKFQISEEDTHPNSYGHKLISQWFIENYNKCLK